ncbi:MAG: hypothetical protein ACREP3_09220 [Candidatus Binatia bacterium]
MDRGLILLHAGLAPAVFLLVLNGHLRKPNKIRIDVALGVLWLGLVGVGFFLFGWKAGLASLVLSLFYALLSKPIAILAARRILGYWTTFRPPWIGSSTDLSDEVMRAHHKETERRIDPISQRPSITKVLAKNGMKAENLREQFYFLVDIGLGIIARDVISNGRRLNRLLTMRQQQLSPHKIASRLMLWR